ncbi:MAG: MFS transporter [Planctomycetes bacterium]|nr:MFS transporter [Planctomycetota bacterium]
MSNALDRKVQDSSVFSTVSIVGWMWVAYFLNYCDRQAVFAMFTALKSELALNDAQLGLTGALFLWVYGIGCPIAGFLADRVSKAKLVVSSLVVWSVVTIATGLSVSPFMLLAMRAAMGISEALFMPAAIALTSEATREKWRSKAVASLTTAQIAGIVGGASFGGWMAQLGHWRLAFFIMGACGLLYALPYGWYLRRRFHTKPDSIDLPEAVSGKPRESTDAKRPGDLFESVLALFRVPTFCMLCIVFPLFVFGLWMIYSWLASYIESKFELTMSAAGWTSTVYLQSATLIGLLVGGYVADFWRAHHREGRLFVLLVSLVGCAPLMVAIGQVDQLDQLKWLLVAFGFCSGWMMGNIFPAAFEVVSPNARGTAVGILNLFGALLSGFAPLLAGAWKQSMGLPGMLCIAAFAYGLAIVVLFCTILFLYPKDWERNASSRGDC